MAELKLRNTIDQDLSEPVWEEAIRLWEDARSIGAWRQIVDVALTLTRLGVRRGNYHQIAGVLDAMIGLVQDRGCGEDLWRFLRIRAQSLEDQGFRSSARESLRSAATVVANVLKDIRSPMFKKAYEDRYDIQSIKNRLDQLHNETGERIASFALLPPPQGADEVGEQPVP